MDELTTVLDGPRAQNAFVVRAVLAPPWALRIQDEAPVTIVAVVRGSCWVRFDDGEPAEARAGDVAILRGPSRTSSPTRPTGSPTSSSTRASAARRSTASTSTTS